MSPAVRWLRSYGAMLRWELISLRLVVPVAVAVQVLAGAGMILGIGLLRDVPRSDALFLASGAMTTSLVLIGLALGPQLVAGQKENGTYEYLLSMPVPRTAAAAAWTTVTFLLGVPGAAVALAVAAWRYDLSFPVGFSGMLAVLMTAITGTLIGYALGHASPSRAVTIAVTQVFIFAIRGFSPVFFPAERLPGWLDRLNDFLPFEPMANVIRGAFTPEVAVSVARSYAVLAAWLVATLAVSVAVLGRRR